MLILGSVQKLRQEVFFDFLPPLPSSAMSEQAMTPHPPSFADVLLERKVSCLMTYATYFK